MADDRHPSWNRTEQDWNRLAGSDNELLSRAQVEQEFGLSRSYLEKCAWRGDGPTIVRLGYRTVRYRRADIVAFINKNSVP